MNNPFDEFGDAPCDGMCEERGEELCDECRAELESDTILIEQEERDFYDSEF